MSKFSGKYREERDYEDYNKSSKNAYNDRKRKSEIAEQKRKRMRHNQEDDYDDEYEYQYRYYVK